MAETRQCNHAHPRNTISGVTTTGSTLQFRGYLGAPGYGVSYECAVCGESFWSSGSSPCTGSDPVPFSDLDHEDYTLSPGDVI